MLKIDHIVKVFNAGTVNEKTALNGLTLHLDEGDFCTVIGGNGAGNPPCSMRWPVCSRWIRAAL